MNKIEMFLAKKALATEEGQKLISDQVRSLVELITDPEVIQGVLVIGTEYVKALTEGLKKIDPEARKNLVYSGVELVRALEPYQVEIERLVSDVKSEFKTVMFESDVKVETQKEEVCH